MHLRAILIAVLAASPAFAQSTQSQELVQAVWSKALQAKLTSHAAALPPITFSPELSIEQNNARLANRDPASYLLAVVSERRSALGSVKDLVGRKCSVEVPSTSGESGRFCEAQVFAFTLSPDRGEITLFVRVSNQKDSGAWLLTPGQNALLRIASVHGFASK